MLWEVQITETDMKKAMIALGLVLAFAVSLFLSGHSTSSRA